MVEKAVNELSAKSTRPKNNQRPLQIQGRREKFIPDVHDRSTHRAAENNENPQNLKLKKGSQSENRQRANVASTDESGTANNADYTETAVVAEGAQNTEQTVTIGVGDHLNSKSRNPAAGQNSRRHSLQNEGGFKQVKYRKRRGVGNSGTNDEFRGRAEKQRKLWLFITKVQDSVREDIIKAYISGRTSSQDVYVKQLETAQTTKDNKSFMIGVEEHLKDRVYTAEFWPSGVNFERFDFRRGRRFLDNQKTNGDSTTQFFSNTTEAAASP